MKPQLSIIIPAYNEEKRLPATLARIAEYLAAQTYSYELIVVDDGSHDGTRDVARAFAAEHSWAELRTYADSTEDKPVNRGKGAAVRLGMMLARGEELLFSDADLSTPIEEMETLFAPIRAGECDIAFASRALPESNLAIHQPWLRETMGRTFNLFVRLAIGTTISDTQCGFKAFRGDAARQIFRCAVIDGFGFDPEIVFLARKFGLRVKEIPVTWRHQEDSRVSPLLAPIQMMRELVQVRANNARGRYRTKE
ncbi:MAG TPA: dolichyl-phosphate beta-glucosyltransferase [Abditibacteriaceae bacterium]|jgi:dolichyl-phosphate beta-glucosyltransferase